MRRRFDHLRLGSADFPPPRKSARELKGQSWLWIRKILRAIITMSNKLKLKMKIIPPLQIQKHARRSKNLPESMRLFIPQIQPAMHPYVQAPIFPAIRPSNQSIIRTTKVRGMSGSEEQSSINLDEKQAAFTFLKSKAVDSASFDTDARKNF